MKWKKKAKELCAFRYTTDAWSKCRPDSNKEEWKYLNVPNETDLFLMAHFDFLKENGYDMKNSVVHMIVIDEEYFEWLKQNGMEHSSESMEKYADTLTTENRTRLMIKNHMQYSDSIAFLSIGIFKSDGLGPSTEFNVFHINEKLRNDLEDLYYPQKVYVPGYVLKSDTARESRERLLDMADVYFTQGKYICLGQWQKQIYHCTSANVLNLYLPYVIRNQLKNASVRYSDIEFKSPTSPVNKIGELITKEISCNNKNIYAFLDDVVLSEDDIEIYEKLFVKMLKKQGGHILRDE